MVGFSNYQQLLFGLERSHFLGVLKSLAAGLGDRHRHVGLVRCAWTRAVRGGRSGRSGWSCASSPASCSSGSSGCSSRRWSARAGGPGALIVTLIFVFAGIALQYGLGLGLALLAVQQVPWRRFFRIVFLIPLTITPVGVGYMFLMMTDTSKGPLEPIWVALGLRDFTWVTDPWLARLAVIIGDTWQWTPFVFIVLLAAIEGLDQEVREAALVDGASRWQSFRHITMPAILPVTTTIILIRLIEGFKIIDMPNILLGGGPGTATQSMTLQAYIDWNTLNLGRSAAVAYLLLILVTVVATVYVSFVRRRVDGPRMKNPFARRSATDLSPPAKFGAFLLLLAWTFVVLFPIYWLFVTSFKTPYDVDKGPFYLPFVDFQPTLDAWRYILVELGNDTLRPYVNTVIVGLSSASIALVLGLVHRLCAGPLHLPAAARDHRPGHRLHGASPSSRRRSARRWPSAIAVGGRDLRSSPRPSAGGSPARSANSDIAFWLISQRILPPIAVAIPLYVLFQQVGLLDSLAALVITYVAANLPIVVWLMRDYFASLPRELEESAAVDGASIYRIVRSIVLPISVPGLVATFLIVLIFAWNEFLIALVLTSANAQTMPLQVAAQNATRGPQWWAMSVLILIMIAPVVVMAIALERYITRGILVGALKG